jgi:hypothetical protein
MVVVAFYMVVVQLKQQSLEALAWIAAVGNGAVADSRNADGPLTIG